MLLSIKPRLTGVMFFRTICKVGLLGLWFTSLYALAEVNPIEDQAEVAATQPATSMPVMYYDRGALDARHAYKFELIHQILEVTRAEFGDYHIIPYAQEPSAKRQSLLISEGRQLNLLWASPGTPISKGDVYTIPFDILHGLLGYRVCLIDNQNKHWPNPRTLEDLKKLRIGQGLNWADVDIYKFNGITPLQAPTFESLFDMMFVHRFDCLPLGADEIMFTYREKKQLYPGLAIEPKLLIYYDYPIYFYVSKKFPRLAQRVQSGLKKMRDSGAFDKLFTRYFAADLKTLQLDNRHLICLKSPYLDKASQTCSKSRAQYFLPATKGTKPH